jgi:Tat protein secretion system quality control protein TatD with DNase activity
MRGKRNEPSFVAHTAVKLSDVLAMRRDDLIDVTDRNACDVFAL